MRKGVLTNGKNCFVVKVEHLVTANVFAKALACHFYEASKDFDDRLTKKSAEEILKRELRWGGDTSNYDRSGVFEGATDSNDIYDPIFHAAQQWVMDKYPYLIKNN